MEKQRLRLPSKMTSQAAPAKTKMFKLGDPTPVLASPLVDYLGVCQAYSSDSGNYYTPPVSLHGLAKVMGANAHHGSAIHFKKNLMAAHYQAKTGFGARDFKQVAFEKVLFGQFYLQRVYNVFGEQIGVAALPGVNMRKLKNAKNQYALIRNGKNDIVFKPDEVIHYRDYDPLQNIYGLPEYLGGLQSVLLNENATLFRRRYYENGNHAGFIFYTADPDMDDETADLLEEKISSTKGVGNFQSMFINIPNGKEKSVQIIPIGDIAQKDEFERIKNVTRNDILAAHRIHRELAAVMPEEGGSSGDITKISRVNFENEILPLQKAMQEINTELPKGLQIEFDNPNFENAA